MSEQEEPKTHEEQHRHLFEELNLQVNKLGENAAAIAIVQDPDNPDQLYIYGNGHFYDQVKITAAVFRKMRSVIEKELVI